jgi:hypothetical protein
MYAADASADASAAATKEQLDVGNLLSRLFV